jgi:hypothetical protein
MPYGKDKRPEEATETKKAWAITHHTLKLTSLINKPTSAKEKPEIGAPKNKIKWMILTGAHLPLRAFTISLTVLEDGCAPHHPRVRHM